MMFLVCLLVILILIFRLQAARRTGKSGLYKKDLAPIENSTAGIYQTHDAKIMPKPKSLNQSHLPHPPSHLLEDTIQ